jgi:hypothetical protein
MKTRKLGNSSLEVSALGFGCMGINHGYATSSEMDLRKYLKDARRVSVIYTLTPVDPSRPGLIYRETIGRAWTSDQDRTGIACFDELNR